MMNFDFPRQVHSSTPPATPVAPRSSLPKTDGKLSYLPPITNAPISKFLSKPQKIFPNNNHDHEQFQNQFEYYLHCDFLTIQKEM